VQFGRDEAIAYARGLAPLGRGGSRSRATRSTSRFSPRSPASTTRRCRPENSSFADDARLEDGYLTLSDRPGIGFEGQSRLYRIMRELAAQSTAPPALLDLQSLVAPAPCRASTQSLRANRFRIPPVNSAPAWCPLRAAARANPAA